MAVVFGEHSSQETSQSSDCLDFRQMSVSRIQLKSSWRDGQQGQGLTGVRAAR